MRISIYLAAIVAMTAAHGQGTLERPGYSVSAPGPAWSQTDSINGGPGPLDTWTFVRTDGIDAKLEIQRISWRDGYRNLEDYARAYENHEGFEAKARRFEAATVNGARCMVSRARLETHATPAAVRIVAYQTCTHPQMPSFAVQLRYELGEGAGALEPELQTIAASIRFKPIPLRVREYRPDCILHALTTAEGAVWASCETGYNDANRGYLVRIDPASEAVTRIEVGRQSREIAAAGGYVWITNLHDQSVSRFDPRTNAVTATIWFPDTPLKLMPAGGMLWVHTEDFRAHTTAFTQIDPGKAAIVRKVHVDTSMWGIGIGAGLMLQHANGGEMVLLDSGTGKLSHPFGRLSRAVRATSFDGAQVWLVESSGFGINAPADVLRLDPGAPEASPVLVHKVPSDVADAAMWNGMFCALSHDAVRCFRDDAVLEVPLPANAPSHLISFAGSLWVEDFAGHAVIRIDAGPSH